MCPGIKLCVVSSFPPDLGGQADYGWHIVHGLEHTGRFREITVLAAGGAAAAEERHIAGAVTVRRVWQRDDLLAPWRLLGAIHEESPDVAWFSLGYTLFGRSRLSCFLGCTLPMIVQHLGIPTVVTLHEVYEHSKPISLGLKNGWLTDRGARLATRMLLQVGMVCVTLRRYASHLERGYGAHRLCHLPLGVYRLPDPLPPAPGPSHDILIFTAHAPYKGTPVLLEAFPQVRHALPQATLTVAGSDHPRFPGYLAELRERTNGLPGVRWLGPQTEAQLGEAFAQARVAVLPYTATTGASSGLHYAAAFGRPVVVSDLPDLRAAAEEENLWVNYVPPGDPAALAETLIRLLADPAEQAIQAAHNLEVARTMTLQHTCARYARLFERVAEGKHGDLQDGT